MSGPNPTPNRPDEDVPSGAASAPPASLARRLQAIAEEMHECAVQLEGSPERGAASALEADADWVAELALRIGRGEGG